MTCTRRQTLVGVGSNCDAAVNIRAGLRQLEREFGTLECSAMYRSPAANGGSGTYVNLVASFDTNLDRSGLRPVLKGIEQRQGRVRGGPEVTLDLDLLVQRGVGAEGDTVAIGADELGASPWVLWPLTELLADWRHPEIEMTLGEFCATQARPPTLERVTALSDNQSTATAEAVS